MTLYGQTVKRVLFGRDIKELSPIDYDRTVVSLPGVCVDRRARLSLTDEHFSKGIGAIGATGSGKTYCIRRMIKDIRMNTNNYSMVIVQAKEDFDDLYVVGDLILEQGNNSEKSIKWNLFNDILADGYDMKMVELNTRQFVKHLFSYKENSKEPFFVEGASELLYCIIITLIKLGMNNLHERKNWTNSGLKKFFLNYNEADYVRIIENCGEPGVLNRILGTEPDNRQAIGVWGELVTTALQTLVDVFAEDGDFSIREFVRNKSNRVLFINYDPSYKDTQVKIFGSMINLMLNEVLSRNNILGSVYLVCDELPVIGKIDIAQAVNIGRAKGLKTIIGCQSIEQLYSIYGEEDGRNLLAGLCTKVYFKPNDLTTKQYMQDDFGKEIADYITMSPGGCYSERREGYVIEDFYINEMQTGECFVNISDGTRFKFKVD